MNAQSFGSPNRDNFETPLWESREKVPFGCKCNGETQRILYGGRWCFPQVRAVVSQVNSVLPVACPSTKGVRECKLTNLLVSLMQVRMSE
jgi:hypothetical protein